MPAIYDFYGFSYLSLFIFQFLFLGKHFYRPYVKNALKILFGPILTLF